MPWQSLAVKINLVDMTREPSTRFGSEITVDNFDDLLEVILGQRETEEHIFMWRGQENADWTLDSSAYRRVLHGSKKNIINESDVASYEKNLIKRAKHRGFDILDGRPISDFELLARLQHHGAATRFIDFSRSSLVALYFSCLGSTEIDGMLFGLHCWNLGGYEGLNIEEGYDEHISGHSRYNHPFTWQPTEISKRVAAQHSQFVYSNVVKETHGSLAIGDLEKYLIAIRIPRFRKEGFRTLLQRAFDIHHPTLFPDLDGFGLGNGPARPLYSDSRW